MKNERPTDTDDKGLDALRLKEREKVRFADREFFKTLHCYSPSSELTNIDSDDTKDKQSKIPWRNDTLVGSAERFLGELNFEHRYVNGRLEFRTVKYRITSFLWPGGNSANINIFIDNSAEQWANNSPDSMRQDKEWNNYVREANIRIWDRWATIYVQFIFDRSGWEDPRVRVYKQFYY